MRKWIVGLIALILLPVAAGYLLIPSQLSLSQSIIVPVTQEGAYRMLADKNTWDRWWPGRKQVLQNDAGFFYRDALYTLTPGRFNGVDLLIRKNGKKIQSLLLLMPLREDSMAVYWQSSLATGSFPWQRIRSYFEGKKLEGDMAGILHRLRSFLSKEENIYGRAIRQTTVKDTILMATRMMTDGYPATEEIYDLVHQLRRYITAQGAVPTNAPMLHIMMQDSNRYQTMVALPVNKRVPGNERFLQKRMVPGNILVTEVKGGPAAVREAFQQLENYVSDYKKESPAIPFESLVTDRLQVKDTAKWITRIYYPVF